MKYLCAFALACSLLACAGTEPVTVSAATIPEADSFGREEVLVELSVKGLSEDRAWEFSVMNENTIKYGQGEFAGHGKTVKAKSGDVLELNAVFLSSEERVEVLESRKPRDFMVMLDGEELQLGSDDPCQLVSTADLAHLRITCVLP